MLKKWKHLFWNYDEKRFRAGYRVFLPLRFSLSFTEDI